MGCQAASVRGTTFGLADQRLPIDQGHVLVPWKRKRQTLSPPKPRARTSALALNGELLASLHLNSQQHSAATLRRCMCKSPLSVGPATSVKFVKAYAHRPVNLEAVAASSSASSEATDGPTGV